MFHHTASGYWNGQYFPLSLGSPVYTHSHTRTRGSPMLSSVSRRGVFIILWLTKAAVTTTQNYLKQLVAHGSEGSNKEVGQEAANRRRRRPRVILGGPTAERPSWPSAEFIGIQDGSTCGALRGSKGVSTPRGNPETSENQRRTHHNHSIHSFTYTGSESSLSWVKGSEIRHN